MWFRSLVAMTSKENNKQGVWNTYVYLFYIYMYEACCSKRVWAEKKIDSLFFGHDLLEFWEFVTMYIHYIHFFRQITTFIKVRRAFVFGLQTLKLKYFSKIYRLKGLKPKRKATRTFMNKYIYNSWFPSLGKPRLELEYLQ